MVPAELSALKIRYQAAKKALAAKKLSAVGSQLEKAIKEQGKAIISTSFDFLWEWLILGTVAYESYRRQLINGARKRAAFANDVRRSSVDSYLFGSEPDIVYAALSVNERGLSSYGNVTAVLRSKSIADRTVALEMNSFDFTTMAASNGWSVEKPLPAGYLSSWNEKHKLGLIKNKGVMEKPLEHNILCDLVLHSEGNRATDRFIELYIFGRIIAAAVEKITLPLAFVSGLDALSLARLAELKRKFTIEEY